MLISTDGGKTFTEEFTPRGLVIDFEVDPADPERIIASTETELFRTEDGGKSWRPLTPAKGIRLSWPEAEGALPRRRRRDDQASPRTAARAGRTSARSAASPTSCTPTGPKALFLVLSDGSILETTDGGATWRDRFRP